MARSILYGCTETQLIEEHAAAMRDDPSWVGFTCNNYGDDVGLFWCKLCQQNTGCRCLFKNKSGIWIMVDLCTYHLSRYCEQQRQLITSTTIDQRLRVIGSRHATYLDNPYKTVCTVCYSMVTTSYTCASSIRSEICHICKDRSNLLICTDALMLLRAIPTSSPISAIFIIAELRLYVVKMLYHTL